MLLTAQSPRGETVHRVSVKAAVDDPYRTVHVFSGPTTDDRLLRYAPHRPLKCVRFVRIETTESPSWVAWREIRLLKTKAPPGAGC
jgi:hypothetical protein